MEILTQDTLREKLLLVARNQAALNAKIHPQWQMARFPFHRAVWTEAAEALGHYPWEWWKKAGLTEHDRAQIGLELADIFHFGMSMLLQDAWEKNPVLPADRAQAAVANNAAAAILPILADESRPGGCKNCNEGYLPDRIEAIASDALDKRFDPASLFRASCAARLGVTGLIALYFGKNALNVFRQQNGYKTGEYIKNWRTKDSDPKFVEDNVILTQIIRDVAASMTSGEYAASLGTEAFATKVSEALADYYGKVKAFGPITQRVNAADQ